MANLGSGGPPDSVPTSPSFEFEYEDWETIEIIGEGGNAVVYRAAAETDQGQIIIAIKQPRTSGTLDKHKIESFLDEAKIWSKLDNNDHIVDIHGWGGKPLPWIGMEYMDGGSLKEITQHKRLPAKQALWVSYCVCKAVLHAHRLGIAHHDIKPANVLFRTVENGWNVPKVSDWGLARVLLDKTDGNAGLTPQYSAPEQFDPDQFGQPDDMTDVYQVGALTYELLTGRPPFVGQTKEITNKILTTNPKPPSEFVNVPQVVDSIILTALRRRKNDRYDTIAYFRDNIEKILQQLISGEESIDLSDKHVSANILQQHYERDGAVKKGARSGRSNPLLTRRGIASIIGSGTGIGGLGWYLASDRSGPLSQSSGLPDSTEEIRLEKQFSTFNNLSPEFAFKYDDNIVFLGNNINEIDPTGPKKIRSLDIPEETKSYHRQDNSIYIGTGSLVKGDGVGKIIKKKLSNGNTEWSYDSPPTTNKIEAIGTGNGYVVAICVDANPSTDVNPILLILSEQGDLLNEVEWTVEAGAFGNIYVTNTYALIGQGESSSIYNFETQDIINASTYFGENIGAQILKKDNILYSVRDILTTVNLDNNNILYHGKLAGTTFSLPVVLNDSIVIGSTTGLYSYDKQSGEQNWHVRTNETVFNRPVSIGNFVFASDGSGAIYGINSETGDILYEYRPLDRSGTHLIPYRNTLIAFDRLITQFKLSSA